MKRVLFTIGKLSGGGAERVVSIWSDILSKRGYEVAIHVAYRTQEEYKTGENVQVECTAETEKEYLQLSPIKRVLSKRSFIKVWKPDVVINFLQSNQIRMLVVAVGIKLRRIETIRINPWRSTANRTLWKMCFDNADAIILQTEDQKSYLSKKNQEKCTVVRNPLAEDYKKADSREYSGKTRGFVAAGRLDEQKNFPVLIEAFSRVAKDHTDVTLDIFGKGDEQYTAYLQECIDKTGVSERIILKGRTNDMCTALMEHDCFIMSSDYEGMPNALAEAMATGMVCISTDCKTGPCDMIENGKNGYLCKTGNADDMERAIRQVLSMPREDIESMGKAARSSILDLCDDEKNIKKLIEVIEG